VSPEVDVDDAMKTMLDGGFRHLPVMEKGEVIGMISMRDLAAEQQ
jgi:CBS domain-containing protein